MFDTLNYYTTLIKTSHFNNNKSIKTGHFSKSTLICCTALILLNKHSNKLNSSSNKTNKHSNKLNNHSNKLNKYSNKLNKNIVKKIVKN